MSKQRSGRDKLKNNITTSNVPTGGSGVQLLPVSHKEFQARWSLSKESLESGLRAASDGRDEPRLILRAYSLPVDADRSDFSNHWHDYRIDHSEDSAFFTLPSPAPIINAAIGLINKSGRFNPLVRGDAVALPPLPDPPPAKLPTTKDHIPRGKKLAYHSSPTSAASP